MDMSKDIIQKIWDKGKTMNIELSVQDMARALRPEMRGHSISIRTPIWIWLGFLLGALVLDVVNIVGYRSNPAMLATQIGLTLLAAVFAAYGIHLLREIRLIDRADENLMALLRRRLRFYRTKFEIWNFMMAVTVGLLSFAINSFVDNKDGQFRIYRPGVFIIVSVLQLAFCYGAIKMAQFPLRKEMRILLSDLEENVTDGRQSLVGLRKKWRIWAVVFFIICTILLLFGIWRALQFGR
jgi:hypothetical protein